MGEVKDNEAYEEELLDYEEEDEKAPDLNGKPTGDSAKKYIYFFNFIILFVVIYDYKNTYDVLLKLIPKRIKCFI